MKIFKYFLCILFALPFISASSLSVEEGNLLVIKVIAFIAVFVIIWILTKMIMHETNFILRSLISFVLAFLLVMFILKGDLLAILYLYLPINIDLVKLLFNPISWIVIGALFLLYFFLSRRMKKGMKNPRF